MNLTEFFRSVWNNPTILTILALLFLREPIPFNMVVGILLILLGSLVSLLPALTAGPSVLLERFARWKR